MRYLVAELLVGRMWFVV